MISRYFHFIKKKMPAWKAPNSGVFLSIWSEYGEKRNLWG